MVELMRQSSIGEFPKWLYDANQPADDNQYDEQPKIFARTAKVI